MEWDLSPLYPSFDDPALAADFALVEKELPALLADIQQADENTDARAMLCAIIQRYSEITARVQRIGQFINLTLSTDATNERALLLESRADKLGVEHELIRSATARYLGTIKDLDSVILSDLLLTEHRFVLEELQAAASHMLSPNIEPWILKMQLTGGNAWMQLRNMLDATHLVNIEVDGKEEKLPLSAVRNMAYSTDGEVRKRAYEAEMAAYPQMEIPMAAALAGIKGEALTLCEARNYPSVLDMTLEEGRLDHETLDAMLGAMKEALPDFRRYLQAKAKLLGYEGGLKFYDLFAPVGEDVQTFSPEEAREYLVRVLGTFSDGMAKFVERAYDARWIDLFPRKGKGGGAFCSGNHDLKQSWVLTNFDGSFSDVSTLAHELGHAFHNMCVEGKPLMLSSYPMQLAETASIFNETLVSRHAIANASPERALTLLEASIMEATQVIVDIYSRYLFESEVIETRKDHAMTPAELKDAMQRAQLASYGDGLAADALHPYMWACKTHYYFTGAHFYNFPYAFGLLFGLGVYAQYEKEGAAFVPKYERLLAATGGDTTANVAASVGIDVRDRTFWRSSLDVIRAEIDQFVALVEARAK